MGKKLSVFRKGMFSFSGVLHMMQAAGVVLPSLNFMQALTIPNTSLFSFVTSVFSCQTFVFGVKHDLQQRCVEFELWGFSLEILVQ